MPLRGRAGDSPLALLKGPAVAAAGFLGESNLAKTNDLIWVMIAIGTAGAIVTFSFLVYAIMRFRDPRVKGRRYG
ncbi:MAG TPA: hypothetical protein VEK13_03815 [Thermoplasmata archaeon]|nr:hypothetical protein [Thermoplasmata archaeon]